MDRYDDNNSNTIENGSLNLTPPIGKEPSQESFLEIALRHRWVILSTSVVFLAFGLLYLLKATPIYTSTSRLYVEQSGPKIISEYEGVMTQSKNYLYTQAELIKSTPIIASVADDAQIKRFKTLAGVDNLAAYIKNALDVSVGRKNDIITLSFDSPYPKEAAQIINALVDSYVKYHSSRKRTTVSEVLRILQKEKVKRDKELSDKFEQMLEFTRTNGVVPFDNTVGNIVFQRLAKLSGALTETQLATINAKADYEAILSMANEPAKIKQFAMAQPTAGIRISVNDAETQLLAELKDLESELKNIKYHCTEEHPSTQAVHTKISHIKQQLNEHAQEFAEAYTEVMRLKWTTAKQREDELLASFEAQQQAARSLSVKAAEYSALKSGLERAERLCEILDNRIKELNVTEDTGALNISILEVARPADNPSKPQKARIMAMALILGIMLGFGLALLRNWLDYRLQSTEEISAILGVPVLGVVPTMSEEQTIVTFGQKVWIRFKSIITKAHQTMFTTPGSSETKAKKQTIMARAEAYRAMRGAMLSGTAKRETKSAVVTSAVPSISKCTPEEQAIIHKGQKVRFNPKSIAAESYRTIRTAIFFGAPKGGARTIVVTSPTPGDGKTTLVSNLAIAMAQAGQKTIILDCDFRKPMQHNIFEIDREIGLSNVFAGTTTLGEAIQPGPVNELDLLTSGPDVPNPSEMLNSDAFIEILKALSGKYDRVIIDSPPVLPIADSQILGAICDTTILVLKAGKSTRKLCQQARDNLLSVGAHILGAIVNDVPRKHGHYGRYSRYGYYGGYGHYGYGYYGNKEKKKQYEQSVA